MVARLGCQAFLPVGAVEGEGLLVEPALRPQFGNRFVLPDATEVEDSSSDALSSILNVGIVVEGVAGVYDIQVAVLDRYRAMKVTL